MARETSYVPRKRCRIAYVTERSVGASQLPARE